MSALPTRQDDELILRALAMRVRGISLSEVGDILGVGKSTIGMATQAVFEADLRESGERAAVVDRGYRWPKHKGARR
ncbi:hypothetical protein [Ketogulonicigenium vulgare]|uniref:Transposase n=1 Tax=Ketogulonicigenium vulgare (strain WSH-001) TaxID=759362 RepID=F9YA19_KETVW|nr:hypothetical protein [Ketogulonicigenium vulgare]ADO43135.1 hypothetical protein EIO_2026 [Ketogulonicigenium vulgare Y25]AEM41430.1 hypothetical protein KVU_1591 [Ketogulonicigenium vulgare WSH-001]ALJ81563.1 hypothetical protein KVH_10485 [Ketogulonicigenium vulgare]ANW35120.1 hypothetical protein KvSKV_10420 [Ketogulonicigenium vulgare]AOZ55172.1 hypothetical protein KVC_2165 [Ketogulonicigenium vulgare]